MKQRVSPRLIVTGIIAIAAAAAVYFTFFAASDEQKIKDVLSRFAKSVRVPEDDSNPILRAARIRGEFAEIFPQDVGINIPELTHLHQGRAELESVATQAPLLFRSAEVAFATIEIKIDDAHVSAKAAATASLRGTRRDGSTERGPRAVNFLLTKDGGKWRITSLTVWPEGEGLP